MQKVERDRLDEQVRICGVALHQRVDPKCANPACPIVFHWLIGGKLFRFSDRQCGSCAGKANAASAVENKCDGHCVKHFWLCERCSTVFTLAYRQPEGVILKLWRAEIPQAESTGAAIKVAAG